MNKIEIFFYAITQRIVWLVTTICMRLFSKLTVVGGENIKNCPTPLLIVSNHRSYWDAMIIGTIFPFFSNRYLPIAFLAADDYFLKPLFRAFFLLTGTYPVYKGMGLDISLQYPRYILKRNGVVLLFPYGKRIIDENVQESPRRGAGVLVEESSNLWIIPIYLNTTSNLDFVDFLSRRNEMSVYIGKPFQADSEFKKYGAQEITRNLVNRIAALAPHNTNL